MTDEMQIEGKSYISSKRAAEVSGYAQDYIGQLARKSLIDAHRIGGLWYVFPESLEGYKKNAETYKPEPPTRVGAAEVGSLVFFDGKEYLSAVSAAQVTGYTQDYVGQLARSGMIMSRQVGNRWYVDRESILRHKKEKDSLLAAVQSQSVGIAKQKEDQPEKPKSLVSASYSGTAPLLNYYSETADLMPTFAASESAEEHILDLKTSSAPQGHTQIATHEQIIPIRREHTKQIATQPIPARLKRAKSQQKKMTLSGSFKLLAGALATIVILLSIGYVSVLNKNAVYAFNFNTMPTVGALPASTVTAFSRIGDMLEPYLTHQLVYVRPYSQ